MNSNRTPSVPLYRKIISIVYVILLIGVMFYGILVLLLGLWEYCTLQNAKRSYAAVPVCVTSITPTEFNASRDIITLEPIDAKAKEKLGATCTTLFQSDLQVGAILTMYYDSNDPQNRIVDFETTDDLLRIGGLLTAIPAALGILYLITRSRKKKHKPPTVMICPEA